MKNFIRKIIKFIARKTKFLIIREEALFPVEKNQEEIVLYNIGLKKTENLESHNFGKQMRFYSLSQVVKYVLKKKEIYDFAECGSWKGHSSYIISSLIQKSNKKINFHIFDSFEGLSKATPEDKDFFYRNEKEKEKMSNLFLSSEDFVKNKVLKEFDFVKTYKGWIPNRFKDIKNGKFSLVHIDVDLYEPTFLSLEFFFPKLEKGGVIICDDYNNASFPGAKNAWNKYFEKKEYQFFYKAPFRSCFIIK